MNLRLTQVEPKERVSVMSLPNLSPSEAKRLIDEGAVLVDIRDRDEHARERVPGAQNHPLSQLDNTSFPETAVVIFHCRSGMRTQSNVSRLAKAVCGKAYVIEGGIDAWRRAGLPVDKDKRQPIEMARQVQIAAGSMVVLGGALGFFVNPIFYALSVFVGAGLIFAGVSGLCSLARLLAYAPWNRQSACNKAST
jgi:rhodanese-related sulfurtransferase